MPADFHFSGPQRSPEDEVEFRSHGGARPGGNRDCNLLFVDGNGRRPDADARRGRGGGGDDGPFDVPRRVRRTTSRVSPPCATSIVAAGTTLEAN